MIGRRCGFVDTPSRTIAGYQLDLTGKAGYSLTAGSALGAARDFPSTAAR